MLALKLDADAVSDLDATDVIGVNLDGEECRDPQILGCES